MNMRQDITMHSDAELSLLVFNDETLYRMRRRRQSLIETIAEIYDFTEEQLDVLIQDIADDLAEEEAS